MATLPVADEEIIRRFGPHRAYDRGARVSSAAEPDREVKTHCCFCGQQCGVILKVKDNTVIGFEPRYDFPFNQGKACPKGVKRYLQGAHPDRLLHAFERAPGAPGGFQELAYARAIEKVAGEVARIQSEHGRDAFAVLTGASLTNEAAYFVGKFAHMCLRTANLDYNGRLCKIGRAHV